METNTMPLRERVEGFARELGYDVTSAPHVLCNDIRYIPEKMWHDNRRTGFGGSDEGSLNDTNKYQSKRELIYRKTHDVKENVSPGQQFIFDFGHVMETPMLKYYASINGYKFLTYRKFFIIVTTEDEFNLFYPKARLVANNTWSIMLSEEVVNEDDAASLYQEVLTDYPDAKFYSEDSNEPKDVRDITDEEHLLYDSIGIVCVDRRQYINANYPCMIGDTDGLCLSPSGERIGLECKTYSFRSPQKFTSGIYKQGGELKDDSYYMQVLHYMATCNLDRFDILACCGNMPGDFTITTIYRDLVLEEEKILCENAQANWERHVIHGEPVREARMNPDQYSSFVEMLDEDSVESDEDVHMPDDVLDSVQGIVEIQLENKNLKALIKANDELVNGYKAIIISKLNELGNPERAVIGDGENNYSISYKGKHLKGSIDEEKLSLNLPDVYAKYLTEGKMSARSLTVSKVAG